MWKTLPWKKWTRYGTKQKPPNAADFLRHHRCVDRARSPRAAALRVRCSVDGRCHRSIPLARFAAPSRRGRMPIYADVLLVWARVDSQAWVARRRPQDVLANCQMRTLDEVGNERSAVIFSHRQECLCHIDPAFSGSDALARSMQENRDVCGTDTLVCARPIRAT